MEFWDSTVYKETRGSKAIKLGSCSFYSQTCSCIYFIHRLILIHSFMDIDFFLCFNNPLLKWIIQNSVEIWTGWHDSFLNLQKSPLTVTYISLSLSSLLSLPTTKTPGMAFRHSEKLKTCEWEEEWPKYMTQNMQSDSWVEKPAKFIILLRSSFNNWISIIHFKTGLLKRRMKSIFHEWIH